MLDLWRTNLHFQLVSFYLRQCNIMNVPYSRNLLSDAPLGPCNRKGGGWYHSPTSTTPLLRTRS